MNKTKVDPRVTNPEAAPYFDALGRGEVVYLRCTQCGEAIFYPRTFCPYCLAASPHWERSNGQGSIYTFVEVFVAPGPEEQRRAPYTLGIIEMSEGFFLFGEIVGTSESLAIGDRVVAGTIVRDGHQLIVFTPVSR